MMTIQDRTQAGSFFAGRKGRHMEFRRATREDVERFLDVRMEFVTEIRTIPDADDFRAATLAYLQSHIEQDDFAIYLALENREIVSCCMASVYRTPPLPSCRSGVAAKLLNVYTKPEFRRRGLAEQLVRMLLRELEACGVEKVQLDYTEAGLPLYRKLGFTELTHQMERRLPLERQ